MDQAQGDWPRLNSIVSLQQPELLPNRQVNRNFLNLSYCLRRVVRLLSKLLSANDKGNHAHFGRNMVVGATGTSCAEQLPCGVPGTAAGFAVKIVRNGIYGYPAATSSAPAVPVRCWYDECLAHSVAQLPRRFCEATCNFQQVVGNIWILAS